MIRTLTIGLAAGLLTVGAANAQTTTSTALPSATQTTTTTKTSVSTSSSTAKCSCTVKKKARRHVVKRKRVVRRTVRHTRTVVMLDPGGHGHTYMTPQTGMQVDPWRAGPLAPATDEQIAVAERLNKGLDLWRNCNWRGNDYAANIFVAWSRTHSVPDRLRAGETVSAEDSFAQVSAYRQRDMNFPPDRDRQCEKENTDLPTLQAQLNSDARALLKTQNLPVN